MLNVRSSHISYLLLLTYFYDAVEINTNNHCKIIDLSLKSVILFLFEKNYFVADIYELYDTYYFDGEL